MSSMKRGRTTRWGGPYSLALPAIFHDFHVFVQAVAVTGGVKTATRGQGIRRQLNPAVPHDPSQRLFRFQPLALGKGGQPFNVFDFFFPRVFPKEDEVHNPAPVGVSTGISLPNARAPLHAERVNVERLIFGVAAETLGRVVDLRVHKNMPAKELNIPHQCTPRCPKVANLHAK